MAIVPSASPLRAEVFASSQTVGKVKVGDEVQLRFPAFPALRAGIAVGRIVAVSPVPSNDGGTSARPGEPMYRITVELDSQQVHAAGVATPLMAGMRVEASRQNSTRPLYEWAFGPAG